MPRNTPKPIVQKLHDAAVAALNADHVRDRLKQLGAEPVGNERRSQDYLQKFVEAEIVKWSTLVKTANIKVE